MNTHAMSKLQDSCEKNGPLCIGLDTDPSYIPQEVLRAYTSPSEAVFAYNKAIIERSAGNTGCYKVQIAYYEAMGIAGLQAYAQTLKAVKSSGVPVIADIKRGDIADTARAYARAHFTGEFEADIITVNPYMGFDTLEPFLDFTKSAGKGFFVLLRTSNPGMIDIEKLPLADGGIVLDAVGKKLNSIADEYRPHFINATCSPVGAVVGCTEESDALALREAYPEVFFLIPGYGAQGGAARIAAALLGKVGGTVNSSRGILTAWKKLPTADSGSLTMDDIANAAAEAALQSKVELLAAKKEYWKL